MNLRKTCAVVIGVLLWPVLIFGALIAVIALLGG